MPIELGITRVAFEPHYHYILLALGVFLIVFAALLAQPIVISYAVEYFTDSTTECTIAIAIYQMSFYIAQWEDKVHAMWVFGMAAFFTLAAGMLVVLLAWKAHFLRFHLLRPTTEE